MKHIYDSELLFVCFLAIHSYTVAKHDLREPIRLFSTILPQKYFTEMHNLLAKTYVPVPVTTFAAAAGSKVGPAGLSLKFLNYSFSLKK